MEKTMINGMELEYEVKGSGEPVLLIATGPIADSFLPFLSHPSLVGHYRLISYHQRGQAGSKRSPVPVSFEQHAADAAALLDHLGIRCAHIAGHSTGGSIALQLALDRPVVLDIFAGSNVTGEIAQELGRYWIAFEADEKYLEPSELRFMSEEEAIKRFGHRQKKEHRPLNEYSESE
jgi:pimeloyl-ACP methyl ester carboxylesterase